MLLPASNLVAISVEGSIEEATHPLPNEEVIDIGEYYGTEDAATCIRVVYVQLKHSTLRMTKPWTLSELRDTLERFSGIYVTHCKQLGSDVAKEKIRFRIVSNRPFGPSIQSPGTAKLTRKAQSATKLSGPQLVAFLGLLSLEGDADDYLGQRDGLRQDLNGYLAGDDADVPVRLKELVSQKALSHNAKRNAIHRSDLFSALQVAPDSLLPAPNLIESLSCNARLQEVEFASAVMKSSTPVVIHAAGGVGKSVLAMRLPSLLPKGSFSVVYDCFGLGSYRQASRPRHNVEHGLVEIANELAARGLCDVLVPSARANRASYFKAFVSRLRQASELMGTRHPEGVVCVIVDAADNAEMAARELQETPSFIRSLLRETLPENIRLVAVSRTERLDLLELPPSAVKLRLGAFSLEESGKHLRGAFPDATDGDVLEFHRLTSANARVQATVMASATSLRNVLKSLGVTPRSVDDTIAEVLERAVDGLLDSASPPEREQIKTLVTAIATLRPFVPLDILAAAADVAISTVESFAADLGRPLLVSDGALQFRDEPTETWFRDRFKARGDKLRRFISVIEALAATHAYAASALPQLLLEAGETDKLIKLALSSQASPSNPAEKRTIEVQRLLFALKAALRAKMHLEAGKLALKAGQEVNGADRQIELFANNLDLIASLWPSHRVLELAGTHPFGGNWLGARHVCEAALFARLNDSVGEARSQIRMANDWLYSWATQRAELRKTDDIPDTMKADFVEVIWRLEGPESCVVSLARWRSRETHFTVGQILARRSLQSGRSKELLSLLLAATKYIELMLGLILELNRFNVEIDHTLIKSVVRRLRNGKVARSEQRSWYRGDRLEDGIVAVVEMAIRTGVDRSPRLGSALNPMLQGLKHYHFSWTERNRRSTLLRAFVLRARLQDLKPTVETILAPQEGEKAQPSRTSEDRETREFYESAGSLLPWQILFVERLFGAIASSELREAISAAMQESAKASQRSYRPDHGVSDEIAVIRTALLCSLPERNDELARDLFAVSSGERGCRFIPTWTEMTRLAAISPSMQEDAYAFSKQAKHLIETSTLEASSRAECYVDLARAFLPLDRAEASALLDAAVVVANKLGYEVSHRWFALLDLADAAAGLAERGAELAYRLSRCAELVYEYDTKHFDWKGTVVAINGLSPTSGLAILSRWHDRRFGSSNYTTALSFQDLVARGALDASFTTPLLWFRAGWDYGLLVRKMLEDTAPHLRADRWTRALRPLSLELRGVPLWREVLALALKYQLSTCLIDERIHLEEEYQNTSDTDKRQTATHESYAEVPNRLEKTWARLRLDSLIYSADELAAACKRWEAASTTKLYLSTASFIDQMFRVAVGHRAVDLIEAAAACSAFDAWDYGRLFQAIPPHWRERLSVISALQKAARNIARRFCMEISRSRFLQPDLLTTLAEISGLSKLQITSETLEALAELRVLDDSERLFSLVGLVAPILSPAVAANALDYGLTLLEEQLSPKTGDGPWTRELQPVENIEAAMTGFLYAKLASPIAALRWEAAHVVVEFASGDGGEKWIYRLLALDGAESCSPFVDQRLPFYKLHARQWLLMAIARVSVEFPERLAANLPELLVLASSGEHVAIRQFAAQAALSGHGKAWTLTHETLELLYAINVSKFAPIISEGYRRNTGKDLVRKYAEGDFLFAYDMDRSWFEPLDRAFGLPKGTSILTARAVIQREWAGKFTGGWKDDPRVQRGVFREREAWSSHSEYPSTDSHSFYLSYHALLFTAGELLTKFPSYQEQENTQTDFAEWLSRHLPSPPDGWLLSDERNPEPLGLAAATEDGALPSWRWLVQRSDFARCIARNADHLILWGEWKTVRASRIETVVITSTLVAADKAGALVRALQSAEDPYLALLPSEHDYDIEKSPLPGFEMLRWLHHTSTERRIDHLDPWAGNIRFQRFDLCEAFPQLITQLHSDGRTWELGGAEHAARSYVWGAAESDESDAYPKSSGTLLELSPLFLKLLLRETSMSLIVKITLERELHKSRYENTDSEYLSIPPYFFYYLFDGGSPRI